MFNFKKDKLLNKRFIPANSKEIVFEKANAVVYKGLDSTILVGYIGKRTKHEFYYSFKTVEARDNFLDKWVKDREQSEQEIKRIKQERKELKSKPHTMKVGDIMYSSWGYDQTNVDFYQVVGVAKNTVKLTEIQSSIRDSGYMSGYVKPVKDAFVSDEVISKRLDGHNYGSLSSFQCLSPYKDGEELYCSWYA